MQFEISNEYHEDPIMVEKGVWDGDDSYVIRHDGVSIRLGQREDGGLILHNFNNTSNRRGYGRKVLCALIHHIVGLPGSRTTPDSVVELTANESWKGTKVGKGLISRVYSPMGFIFDDYDPEIGYQSYHDWMEPGETHEKGGPMTSTVQYLMDYCLSNHWRRPRPGSRSGSRSRSRSRSRKRKPRSKVKKKTYTKSKPGVTMKSVKYQSDGEFVIKKRPSARREYDRGTKIGTIYRSRALGGKTLQVDKNGRPYWSNSIQKLAKSEKNKRINTLFGRGKKKH